MRNLKNPFSEGRSLQRRFDLYLKDIVEAIDTIFDYLHNETFSTFVSTKLIRHGVVYNLEIIGEAASKIPDEIKIKYSHVPWRSIKNFRNIAAHQYWKLNKEAVWDIIQNQLPELKKEIESILQKETP